MVCAEELENQVQTAHPEIWLQKVKNLRMPVEFLCKEKDFQRSGSRCHQLLKELEYVPQTCSQSWSFALLLIRVLAQAESCSDAGFLRQRLGNLFQVPTRLNYTPSIKNQIFIFFISSSHVCSPSISGSIIQCIPAGVRGYLKFSLDSC